MVALALLAGIVVWAGTAGRRRRGGDGDGGFDGGGDSSCGGGCGGGD